MQPQFAKPKSQDGGHCFFHYAFTPESTIEFIPCFCAMKPLVEMKETARSNQFVVSLERDAPTKSLTSSVACLYLSDQLLRLIERFMRLMPIELHGFIIRKYSKQRFCIIWHDLP